MPKFDLDINTSEAGVAEGYQVWPEDKLPPNGSYNGKMKIVGIGWTGPTAKNPGAPMFKLGVELVDSGEYTGFVAWRNLVMVNSTGAFINQWLRGLTDGSDEEYENILEAFNREGGIRSDETKQHVVRIGGWNINSPNGELPVKVSLKRRNFYDEQTKETTRSVQINSFLVRDSGVSAGGYVDEDEVAEEPDVEVTLDNDEAPTYADESIFDDLPVDQENEESVSS